jgi:hypothetical protein
MTIEWYPVALPQKLTVRNSDDVGTGAAVTELEISRDKNLRLTVSIHAPHMNKGSSWDRVGSRPG